MLKPIHICPIFYIVTAKSVTDVDEFTENHQVCILILRWKVKSKPRVKWWLKNYFAFGWKKKKSKRKWSGNSIRFYFSYPKLARLYDDIASLSWHFCPWDFLKCVGSKLLDFHTWCSIQNFKIKLPPSKYLRI